jgi:hypothetical protein
VDSLKEYKIAADCIIVKEIFEYWNNYTLDTGRQNLSNVSSFKNKEI